MFLLYLGEKGTEEHIVTEGEIKRGCFALNERAEFGSVTGLMEEDYLGILEYQTQKKADATNENGTSYVGYDNIYMATGDKIQLQYVKFLEREESIGRNEGFVFKAFSPDNEYFPPRKSLNLCQISLLNKNFIEMLEINKEIEVIIAESMEEKAKYFIFGFRKKYYGPDFRNQKETFDEVEGSVDSVVAVTWG